MLRFEKAQLIGLIVGFIQLIILNIMLKLDDEVNLKLNLKDKLIIVITQITAECWIAILTPMDGWHLGLWIQQQLFIVLFEIQSYIDNKIKLIYDFLTYIVIAYQVINLLDFQTKLQYSIISIDRVAPLLFLMILLLILTAKRGLGEGDFLIYIALAIHYLTYADNPWFTMAIGIMLGQMMFLAAGAVDALLKKQIDKHRPFTMYLQIAQVFTFYQL